MTQSQAPIRVGILGAGGQLGRCLSREVQQSAGTELAFALNREALDLTDAAACEACLDLNSETDVVINAAAWTRVDDCESDSGKAHSINAEAPARWAAELAKRGIRFIHVSTDYVFDGEGASPYREADAPSPASVYGASKLAGEQGVLSAMPEAVVVRTSWVFGPGRNFVGAILEQAAQRRSGEKADRMRVVSDQWGAPTYAADLAEMLVRLSRGETKDLREAKGLIHLCNQGKTTWFGFARQILDEEGYAEVEIDPVPTSTFPTPARRPAFSVLDCSYAESLGLVMRPWTEALSSYLEGPDRPSQMRPAVVDTPNGSSPGDQGRVEGRA